MFEVLIGIMVIGLYIAMFGMPIVLLLMRILEVVRRNINIKEALLIVLLPFSIGYFYLLPAESRLKKVYRGVATFFFVLLFIGSLFVLYQSK